MLEIFDLYLGFEVPWWNSAVNDIDDINKCKVPRTMDYLCNKLAGDEYNYLKRQLLHGLQKGRDELLKMTSRHYLKAPIIFVLLTHHEHGAPFLRAVLLVLYSSQDTVDEPLIHNPDSSKWGPFIYRDNIDRQNTCPTDEVKWFNVVSNFSGDIVHWWQQFGLNRKCCVTELQHLGMVQANVGHKVMPLTSS
jgi:hypothetical protein